MRAKECPPGYNGGFCADYDVDCEACWEQYRDKEKRNHEKYVVEEYSPLAGRWYAISDYGTEAEAGNDCKYLKNRNGDYYRVVKIE